MKKLCIVLILLISISTGCANKNEVQKDKLQIKKEAISEAIVPVVAKDTTEINKIEYDNIINTDYVRALRTLDEFLHLWMYRNWPEGLKYISDSYKNIKSEEELKIAICGISNPHHMSFEVFGAKKIDEDTFQFNVWLYEDITGENNNVTCERSSPAYIVVKRYKSVSGEEQWMIDKF